MMGNRKALDRRLHTRAAFSLLEVVMALGILAGAIIVLGELARLGIHNARAARDLSRCQMLCETKLAEYTSGIYVPEPVTEAAFETDLDPKSEWLYSVALGATADQELLALSVTVTQRSTASPQPVEFTLARWIRDPDLLETTDSGQTQTSGAAQGAGGGDA
jgi:type II secretory pathway pseudopilin PulG